MLNYLLLNLSELILASSFLRITRPQHHDEVQALRWGPLLDRIASHGGGRDTYIPVSLFRYNSANPGYNDDDDDDDEVKMSVITRFC